MLAIETAQLLPAASVIAPRLKSGIGLARNLGRALSFLSRSAHASSNFRRAASCRTIDLSWKGRGVVGVVGYGRAAARPPVADRRVRRRARAAGGDADADGAGAVDGPPAADALPADRICARGERVAAVCLPGGAGGSSPVGVCEPPTAARAFKAADAVCSAAVRARSADAARARRAAAMRAAFARAAASARSAARASRRLAAACVRWWRTARAESGVVGRRPSEFRRATASFSSTTWRGDGGSSVGAEASISRRRASAVG